MKFINRHNEIAKLRQTILSEDSSLIIVYGRRRCGKSTLLKQILQPNDVYFQADLNSRLIQISSLANEIDKEYEGFARPQYADWDSLFLGLTKYVKPNTNIIFDEFPYLVKNSPELPSVLQRLIDSKCLNYNIILCGSSQQMMYEIALKKSEPLYGRASLILKIKPMKAGYIGEAIAGNPISLIADYAVVGGVPRYWEIRNRYSSVLEFIQNEAFDKDSIFYNEPIRLLTDDMRSSVNAYSLLTLIGQGCNRISEIAARMGKPTTDLSAPIANLIDLGYVKRIVPFGESEKNSKKSIYKISDEFFRFYFNYILPNKSSIELDLKNRLMSKLEKDFGQYVSLVWEDMVRESIPYSDIDSKEWDLAKSWWGKDLLGNTIEVDVVAESTDRKSLLIGEVKWSDTPDFNRIQLRLQDIATTLPFVKNYTNVVLAQWHKSSTIQTADTHVFYLKDVLALLR